MLYPALQPGNRQRVTTEQFLGLDRRPRTNDGAFEDMQNMSGDPWPLLSARKRRGLVATLTNPLGLVSNNGLLWIDGTTLYHNGTATAVTNISTSTDMKPKRIAMMGAYVVIFPDGLYYNTADATDYGSINRLWGASASVTMAICDMDGTVYPENKITVSETEPDSPADGDYWIDSSQATHALYQYRADFEDWQGIATVYIKLSATNIGKDLNVQDNVEISGISYSGSDESLAKQLALLNATHVVQARGDDYIVIIGILDASYTQATGIRADRKAPQMDYVIESNNRLWGCRYGLEGGKVLNEIYASALGDFKNWRKYQGTSQDSYAVSVGTEGPFTGAVTHHSQPYFFKANAVHKIYGEKPSNYQMQTLLCEGVREGCADTLLPIGGNLYYVAGSGVQLFESMPQEVGRALGDDALVEGCAGSIDGKYYLSVKDGFGAWTLYVMDTMHGVWHKEDASHALAFARKGDELYMLLSDGKLYSIYGTEGTKEGPVSWMAESAVMGYEKPGHQYLGRFQIRVQLGENARCRLYIQYDGAGPWEEKGGMQWQGKTRTYVLPVIPKRCDTMKLRLVGEGDAQIYGISRMMEIGADGQSKGKILK